MVSGAFATFGFGYLCLAFAALHLFTFVLDLQCGAATSTATSAEAPLPFHYSNVVVEVLPPLAALGLLFVAVALTYRHLIMTSRHAGAAPVAGAGNGRRTISRLVMLALCVSAGTLESIVFGQAAGGGGALGLAALLALPAVATGTFFGAMMLIIVRAGGVGGRTGGVAGDGDEPIQWGLLLLLAKVAAGMAAALVGLMITTLAFHNGAKY